MAESTTTESTGSRFPLLAMAPMANGDYALVMGHDEYPGEWYICKVYPFAQLAPEEVPNIIMLTPGDTSAADDAIVEQFRKQLDGISTTDTTDGGEPA